ncbi:hypothetical protein B9T33_06380 [Acinetobacter sp. ANC 5054]|nr:hypothetical protein [Acinetobacter sp. ANC 5054]OTG81293.1 hypothetical protein B9T33_06380 [Acinetobacter sp. ANC 5054]
MQIKKIILVLMCMSGLYASPSWARLIQWQPQIPSALDAFQGNPKALADLTGDQIIIFAHPTQNINLPTMKYGQKIAGKYYSAAVVVPTQSKNVSRLLSNYSNYAGLFPTLKSAEVLEQNGAVSQVKYNIHIPTPIPVLNFKENVVMQHQIQGNSITSLVIDAPVPYGVGKLEWFELSPNQTLITVTQWGDLNHPKGFLFSKILNALPDAKLGIPAGTNGFLIESLQRRFKTFSSETLDHGQLPDLKLSANQIEKIILLSKTTKEPVSYIVTAQRVPFGQNHELMRFSTSYQYYPHSPSNLQNWINAASFQSLFPKQVKEVQVQKLNQHLLDANYKISVGLGVISIPFDFKMRFDYPDLLQNQYTATGGDLKFVRGSMHIRPLQQGSLLQLTSAVKIHDKAPFLLRAMRSMPYHDILPALGANTVLALKIKEKLS